MARELTPAKKALLDRVDQAGRRRYLEEHSETLEELRAAEETLNAAAAAAEEVQPRG